MSADANKQLMQQIFSELANGNGRPMIDATADDCSWVVTGTTAWSRTYSGKDAIVREVMAPLFAQFADRYTNTPERFIANGDHVVVESRGRVTTKQGLPYNQSYCLVCRLADGQLREVTEYLDTELVTAALAPPGTGEPVGA